MSEEMFNEAIRAFKGGQRRRARDLFTRLLKTEPNNVDYWLWMSATVETEKEQIFCLQKALKIDPNSVAARRGLVALGGLKPEEAGLPPAPTLDEFVPAMPTTKAMRAAGGFLANSRNREMLLIGAAGVVAVVTVGALLIAIFAPEIFRPRRVVVVTLTAPPTLTASPTSAATLAPTLEPCVPPRDPNPATPLAVYLCAPETTPRPFVPTESSNRPEEAYQAMRNGYRAGDWQRVIRFSDQAISLYASDPYPYFYLAEAYRNLGGAQNLREAARNYQLAINQNGSFAPAYYGRALVRFAQGDMTNALKDLDSGLAADPNLWPAYLARAEYYNANGNNPRALEDAEAARRLAPDDAGVLATLALIYASGDRAQEALDTANQALAINRAQPLAYYARGQAHLALEEYDAADQDLSLARPYLETQNALYPSLWQAQVLYYFALARAGIGDDEAALAALNDAIDLRKDNLPSAYLARGQLLLRAQKVDEARSDFNTAIGQYLRSDPENPALAAAYVGNGLALLAASPPRTDGATSNFQAALRIAPQDFDASLGLGRAYLLSEKLDDAVTTLTLALSAATDESQQAQVYLWRAQAFDVLGRPADQIADLLSLAALTEAADLASTAQARLTEIGPLPSATLTATVTSAVTATRTGLASRTPTATRTLTPTRTPPGTPSPSPNASGYPAATGAATGSPPPGGYPGPRTPTAPAKPSPTRTP